MSRRIMQLLVPLVASITGLVACAGTPLGQPEQVVRGKQRAARLGVARLLLLKLDAGQVAVARLTGDALEGDQRAADGQQQDERADQYPRRPQSCDICARCLQLRFLSSRVQCYGTFGADG